MANKRGSFEEWMGSVDRYVQAFTHGVSVYDLPDCCFRDWYDDETSPMVAARRAIRDAKY